jgi:DNA-binding LacI/PurR family transcriptional regulator
MARQTVGQKKHMTIHDVAAHSGVSYQTVSRVINNMPDVAPKTRLRILNVMEELGYRPNMTARHLVSQRSAVIGFVTWATGFYGPAQIMINVERAARETDYTLMFAGIRDATIDRIRRAVNKLCAHRVAGILMHLPFEMDLRPLREMCANVPLVAVDCDLGFPAPSVHVRQEHGAYLATKHLLSLGHTKIAYLRGPMVWRVARLRYQGWLRAMNEAGYSPGPGPCIDGNWTSRGGFEAAHRLVKEYRGEFTALAVANDQMALGAIQAFEENGLRVPQDVSIVGFDNLPEAEFFRPPLSTIKHDFGSIGTLSIRCLMEQLRGNRTTSQTYTIEPTFVERLSASPHCSSSENCRDFR